MKNSYLKTIFYSFYSDAPYMDALKKWRGFGLKYLLTVTALSSVIIIIGWMWNLNKIDPLKTTDSIMGFIISEPDLPFEDNINKFINILTQIPEIKIENGKTITPAIQPYSITDPVTGYDIAIIDTTGKYKSLEGTDAYLLLTESKLITKTANEPEKVIYLNDIEKRYSIDEKSINEVLFILAQIPPFSMHSGEIITKDNKLYKIFDNRNKELAEIGPEAALSDKQEPMLAISSSNISFKNIVQKDSSSIKVSSLNEQLLFEIIGSTLTLIKKILLWGASLLALPFIILTSFIFNGLMLVFYAFIGYSYIRIMKLGDFKYQDVMRIAVVAITPMLLAGVILPQVIPSQGIVYFLISIGYLYYAIKSVTTR